MIFYKFLYFVRMPCYALSENVSCQQHTDMLPAYVLNEARTGVLWFSFTHMQMIVLLLFVLFIHAKNDYFRFFKVSITYLNTKPQHKRWCYLGFKYLNIIYEKALKFKVAQKHIERYKLVLSILSSSRQPNKFVHTPFFWTKICSKRKCSPIENWMEVQN